MVWVSVYLEYSVSQSIVCLTGKVVVLKHWVTDVILSHFVTRESKICGRKLDLRKVIMRIERGRENWLISLRVASMEKTSAGLVMRVLGT